MVKLLRMGEFAYNNSRTSATSYLPLYANYGYHLNTCISQTRTDTLPVASKADRPWMTAIHHDCHKALDTTRQMMKKYAD
jgi:hypothetical protein